MSDLNRILATTDFSAHARHAAKRAALVSKNTTTPLDLLHVANFAPLERLRQLMGTTPDDMERLALDTAREKLHDLAASLKQHYGVAAGTRVAVGSLLAELANEAERLAAGLLVCGAQGESVVRNFLLGTTALRLLRTTTCPVLVVKQLPHEPYRRLLVPVDFSPSSMRAVQQARTIAPQADIVLLHAFEVPFEEQLQRYDSVDEGTINHYRSVAKQDATEKLHALRSETGLSPYGTGLVVLHGNPVSRIIEQEQEQDCDLIVMGKYGESMLEELLLGSVTRHVLAESQSDVLVVPV